MAIVRLNGEQVIWFSIGETVKDTEDDAQTPVLDTSDPDALSQLGGGSSESV